jgi:glycosyltransferase involved in cell wall biosynthesis
VRVAICGGVLVEHDAISFSIRSKLDLLREARDAGSAVEVRAFVHATDHDDDPDVQVVSSGWSLANDPWFTSADVLLFEFGIRFDLLDAIHLVSPDQIVLGVFHNVTPPQMVEDPVTLVAVLRSAEQVHNLSRCAEIVCDSEFNRRCLHQFGVDDVRTSILELPPARPALPRAEPSTRLGTTRFLFVGRFVRSKGIHDLIRAVRLAIEDGAAELQLVLAGSPMFSDADLLAWLAEEIGSDLVGRVELHLAPGDGELAELFASADVVVLPSYHEGYGMPVVEAMASGCHLITYDNSSLPDTAAGLGVLVPTGDVPALAAAMADHCQRRRNSHEPADLRVPTSGLGEIRHDEWLARAGEVVERRSHAAYRRGVLDLLTRHGCPVEVEPTRCAP